MSGAEASLAPARVETSAARPGERFLTWSRGIGVALFLLFAFTFDEGQVHDDGLVYFSFMRRFFGADTPTAALQFGSDFWNTPFYLVSQLVAARGELDRYHAGEISVALASNAAVVVILYLGWRILRELDLPRGPAVLLLALFGTPLYYYGALWVSYKHAADTLYATALFWFVLRSTQPDARRRHFVAAGTCLALLIATRYANAALWLGVLLVLAAYRRRRAAGWMLGTALLASAVAFALPAVRHIPYASSSSTFGMEAPAGGDPPWATRAATRLALGPETILRPVSANAQLDPMAPVDMLFTDKRGLFVWTPLTALATVGFVRLARRDRRNRPFLLALGVSALALLLVHVYWGKAWTGGGSFSQRLLTALFPFFLVGTAELLRRSRRAAAAALAPCALFSTWLGLVLFNGYYGENADQSMTQVAGHYGSFLGPAISRYHEPPPADSIQNFGRQIGDRIEDRWRLYWRLLA